MEKRNKGKPGKMATSRGGEESFTTITIIIIIITTCAKRQDVNST
jgi:hypothetical protein